MQLNMNSFLIEYHHLLQGLQEPETTQGQEQVTCQGESFFFILSAVAGIIYIYYSMS